MPDINEFGQISKGQFGHEMNKTLLRQIYGSTEVLQNVFLKNNIINEASIGILGNIDEYTKSIIESMKQFIDDNTPKDEGNFK